MRAAVLLPDKVCISEKDSYVTSDPPFCDRNRSCIVPELKLSDLHFRIPIGLRGRNRNAFIAAMVDCGATALFISDRFVKENRIRTCPLEREIPLFNIDGSKNRAGRISRFARLKFSIGKFEDL